MSPEPILLTSPHAVAALLQGMATLLYALAQAGLLLYASHRYTLLLGRRGGAPTPPAAPVEWPAVTVQLPVYNEPAVIERLIDAAAALDYPSARLSIQVLDDSSDETPRLAAAAVARARERGIDIVHLRRGSRHGFKAGALAHGLRHSSAPLVAVFDADFVPPRSFLRRLVPHFADEGVGLVQARWGHLDRDRSWLTRAQAAMLDAHFLLEHAARQRRGLFFNFNGTAGIWRRRCIDSAGGWSHDTLTEDLDLSYRAQLAGWRFVFDPTVVVPAELPGDMRAFQTQQRRWTTGAIQTARKLLPPLLARPLSRAVKAEAVLHLTANAAYPLLLLLSLLLPFVLAGPRTLPPAVAIGLQCAVFLLGALPVALFLLAGQRSAGRPWGRALPDSVLALTLGVGMAFTNSRAALAGLRTHGGVFERTPKRGDDTAMRSADSPGVPLSRPEAVLATLFASMFLWAASAGHASALPFLTLLVAGFGWVGSAAVPGSAEARHLRDGPRGIAEPELPRGARSSASASP